MKVTILILFFLLISCERNPVAPPVPIRHDFVSGNLSDDFSLLIKTTDYYDMGDGGEIDVIVDMENILIIKDKRFRSVRENDPVRMVKWHINNSVFTGKQAISFFERGKNDVEVEIVTKTNVFTINVSIFGVKEDVPSEPELGNFMRGPIRSGEALEEELIFLEKNVKYDSAEWVASNIIRLLDGFCCGHTDNVEVSVTKLIISRMFQFLTSDIDETRYSKAITWAYIAIKYAYTSLKEDDFIEMFYLRFVIESPYLLRAKDNRICLELLKRKDYDEFSNLVSDVENNPSVYADKDSLTYYLRDREEGYEDDYYSQGSESLLDIAQELF